MKGSVLRTAYAAMLCSILGLPAFSQNYFFVIGTFTAENENVRSFISHLPRQQSDTAYTLQADNGLLHFYVLKTTNKDLLLKSLGGQQAPENSNTITAPAAEELTATAQGPATNKFPGESASDAAASLNAPASGGMPVKSKGQLFKFTIATEDGKSLPAKIHQIDFRQQQEVNQYNSETYVDVMRTGRNEPVALVCGVFGYKELFKYIDYTNPAHTYGAHQDQNGAWVIPYTLYRLEAGDVTVMYNTSFYRNSTILAPESKSDLDELVSLMNLNPDYEIRIHTHCNGKNSRTIFTAGDPKNYFELNNSGKMKATAKELTVLRGEVIKSYLVDHNIDAWRVQVHGWGGSDMLVGEDHEYARLNDRTEIEILKD